MRNPGNLGPAAASRVPMLDQNVGYDARTAAPGGRGRRFLCVAAAALLVFLSAACRSSTGVRSENTVLKRATAADTTSTATGSDGGWSWAAVCLSLGA